MLRDVRTDQYRDHGQDDGPPVDPLGTAHGHWDENLIESPFSHGLTGIVDSFGRDMGNEITTGWVGPGTYEEQWLSQTTVATLVDIGFQVSYAPMPEPTLLATRASPPRRPSTDEPRPPERRLTLESCSLHR